MISKSKPDFSLLRNAIACLIVTAIVILVVYLSGCAHVPPGALTHWDHKDSYGPFFQDHFSFNGVVKNTDGTLNVSQYEGSWSIMGFGPTDSIQGLVIDPATAAKSSFHP